MAALVVSAPLLLDLGAMIGPDSWRSFDWLETAKLNAFARISLLKHGMLPFWNPLLEGGFPQFSHPSDGSLSPLILPTLLLGEAAGMKVTVILALVLGAVGTALLGRDRLGLTPWWAAFAGSASALIGWVPSRLAIGYYESALYGIFPLIIWLVLQSEARPRRLFGATILVALAALHVHLGMVVLMIMLVCFVVLEVARRAAPVSHLWRLGLVAIGGVVLAAFKLIPMFQELARRGMRQPGIYSSFGDFYSGIVDFLKGLVYVVPEMGLYDARGEPVAGDFGYVGLGVPLMLLAIMGLGVSLIRPRKMAVAAILFMLFAWLCFGDTSPVDLYGFCWKLPVFSSLRGALRYFTFGLALSSCLLAAGALQWLSEQRVARVRTGRIGIWLLVAASLAWPAIQSMERYHTSFTRHVPEVTPMERGYYQERLVGTSYAGHLGGDSRYDRGNTLIYANLKAGVGTVYRPEDIPTDSPVKGRRTYSVVEAQYQDASGYRGEAYCKSDNCHLKSIEVNPTQVNLKVHVHGPALLVVNQNTHPGWQLDSGRGRLVEMNGLLAVKIDSIGEAELRLAFGPPAGFWIGLLCSVLTLAAGWILTIRIAKRKRQKINS